LIYLFLGSTRRWQPQDQLDHQDGAQVGAGRSRYEVGRAVGADVDVAEFDGVEVGPRIRSSGSERTWAGVTMICCSGCSRPGVLHNPSRGGRDLDTLRPMRRIPIGCALAAVVFAAGCSSSGPAPTRLPPIASASGTAAPSPPADADLPDPGADANVRTAAGASAFASFYLDLVGKSFVAANPSGLKRQSSDTCQGCKGLIVAIENLASKGQHREGGLYQVLSAVTPGLSSDVTVVNVQYRRNASRVLNASGQAIASGPAVPVTDAQLQVTYVSGRWLASGYRIGQ